MGLSSADRCQQKRALIYGAGISRVGWEVLGKEDDPLEKRGKARAEMGGQESAGISGAKSGGTGAKEEGNWGKDTG